MFDQIAPTVFWPLFALTWLLVSFVVGVAVGRIIRWCDTPPVDHVAEQKRRIARNGFKSRIGAK